MARELDPMAGAGRERLLTARWVVTGELVAQSPLHLGGPEDGAVDAPILRDRVSGHPFLPGTSLAGALRSHLEDVLAGYRTEAVPSEEAAEVALLFGGARGDDEGLQSPLLIFDALGKPAEDKPPEIRDGVALQGATGTAEEHKKFDLEVLPAGARFPVRFELLVPDGEDEGQLLALLRTALGGLEQGEVPLGARGSRGLGRCRASRWRARRFDLTSADGWRAWLATDPEEPFPGPSGPYAGDAGEAPRSREAEPADLTSALRRAWPALGELAALPDRRLRFRATVHLRWPGAGLLVRSPGTDPRSADVAHLHSGGEPVLPGTSLAGAVRARALRIARVVPGTSGPALVDDLFGPRLEGTTDPGFEPAASRLTVTESPLAGGDLLQASRIRVDRFTGGVVDGALFDEVPLYRTGTTVELEIRNPERGEIGLLLLVLKDLLTGDLPVGGTASVGRGVAKGSAELRWPDGRTIAWDPDSPLHGDDARALEAEVERLRRAPQQEPGAGRGAAQGGQDYQQGRDKHPGQGPEAAP